MSAPPPELPDCQVCGACCFGLIVRVDPDDADRFTPEERAALMTDPDDFGLYHLRQAEGARCVALARVAGQYVCTVYERRPGVCRAFERGTRACAEARRAAAPPA